MVRLLVSTLDILGIITMPTIFLFLAMLPPLTDLKPDIGGIIMDNILEIVKFFIAAIILSFVWMSKRYIDKEKSGTGRMYNRDLILLTMYIPGGILIAVLFFYKIFIV